MDHNLKDKKINVMIRDNYNVGYVARSISRRIVGRIRVVGLRFTMHKKHK